MHAALLLIHLAWNVVVLSCLNIKGLSSLLDADLVSQ